MPHGFLHSITAGSMIVTSRRTVVGWTSYFGQLPSFSHSQEIAAWYWKRTLSLS